MPPGGIRQDQVSRDRRVVLIALVAALVDGDVPFQPVMEEPGARPEHLIDKIAAVVVEHLRASPQATGTMNAHRSSPARAQLRAQDGIVPQELLDRRVRRQ